MIYEILVSNIPSALEKGVSIIIISADGQHALIESNTAEIDYIESYPYETLDTLLNQEKWRQPCIDCEV